MRKSDGLSWWQSGKPAGPLVFTRKYLASLTMQCIPTAGLLISIFKEDVTEAKYLQENIWQESPTAQCLVHICIPLLLVCI